MKKVGVVSRPRHFIPPAREARAREAPVARVRHRFPSWNEKILCREEADPEGPTVTVWRM